ncbi:nitrogen fixation protein NifQ [Vibrio salinus]|uniref:nitrogen fixation protein NifQ n=1 Tax=Vibrio salinus TaxID=2899784 RepID=UPI001E35556A|nr:nitrogen fixation protein NifQ [Vibrio salinus]MCE0495512.1 nitrogen fixation protein NifQ [Vibrio salinus]
MNTFPSGTDSFDHQPHSGTFWIAILDAYLAGKNFLPPYMGLDPKTFAQICTHFNITVPEHFQHNTEKRQVISDLAGLRLSEQQDLINLLNHHLHNNERFSENMSSVLSAACMGTQHLWKDLGMPERPLLTQLFDCFYPGLSTMNKRNMRWKRFLYRQLCASGGDYVCRAPSCETCTSFNECFTLE